MATVDVFLFAFEANVARVASQPNRFTSSLLIAFVDFLRSTGFTCNATI